MKVNEEIASQYEVAKYVAAAIPVVAGTRFLPHQATARVQYLPDQPEVPFHWAISAKSKDLF